MSRNGKIHTKKRQFRQMPVLAFLNQRLFLQPLFLTACRQLTIICPKFKTQNFLSCNTRAFVLE